MDYEQISAALQKVHELPQQNAPESAGAVWLAFWEELVAHTRMSPGLSAMEVIVQTLMGSDLPIEELLP